MGVARLIRRASPLIVLGLAGAVAARRRGERMRHAQLTPPPFPPPVATAEPVVEAEPEAAEEPKPQESEVEEPDTEAPEEPQVVEASSVTDIVDDLLAPWESAERIEDVTLVEGSGLDEEATSGDEKLAAAVRRALAEQPGLLPGTVDIEVQRGVVHLSGQVERGEAITELERRSGEVPGVRSVSSLLHLPGTPPPAAGGHR